MRILLVGSGGREHALAWKLAQGTPPPTLFIAPGNPGTAAYGTNVDLSAHDIAGLCAFAEDHAIELVVVGPERPLVEGLADQMEARGIPVIGPSAQAAQLEGSKAFAKSFMARHHIPTADYRTFTAAQFEEARAHLHALGAPVVVKASGLAAGKGAVVCASLEEAEATLAEMLQDRRFGVASDEVVIEAFMEGEEASVFVLAHGASYVLLATAQDHKRIGEGDTGPNTGGMGAYAPAPIMTPALLAQTRQEIIEPTLQGMVAEKIPYKGFLYVGLMITAAGPKVVEYNCRMGDPETQVVMPLLQENLLDVFTALVENRLGDVSLAPAERAAACVVLASKGYPGAYPKGFSIHGVSEAAEAADVLVFQAGTRQSDEGVLETSGGRVLGVTATAEDLQDALDRAYAAVDQICFEGMQYRRDIGQKGLQRLAEGEH